MIIQVKCPNCSEAASAFLIHLGDHTVFGAATKHYLSSCVKCGGEFEAVEFLDSAAKCWQLNKYRPAAGVDGVWTVVQDLPDDQLPLVVTGPGGEYYKAVQIKESRLVEFFKQALIGFKKVVGTAIGGERAECEGCEKCECGKGVKV